VRRVGRGEGRGEGVGGGGEVGVEKMEKNGEEWRGWRVGDE